MKTLATLALATTAALALAACGSTTDASEDAIADTVEMPADQAMADAPEPVADDAVIAEEAAVEEGSAEDGTMDAMEAAETAEDMVAADSAEPAE